MANPNLRSAQNKCILSGSHLRCSVEDPNSNQLSLTQVHAGHLLKQISEPALAQTGDF